MPSVHAGQAPGKTPGRPRSTWCRLRHLQQHQAGPQVGLSSRVKQLPRPPRCAVSISPSMGPASAPPARITHATCTIQQYGVRFPGLKKCRLTPEALVAAVIHSK